jgi:hypothetical protein
MSDARAAKPAGCLLCLIQASESMRRVAFKGRARTTMDAALVTVDRLLDDLVALASRTGRRERSFEVAVLAYQQGADGKTHLRNLLPGATCTRLFVPVGELIPPAPGTSPSDPGRWARVEPAGPAHARSALKKAGQQTTRWALEHPEASHPILVHLTDGESTDGPFEDVARALREGPPPTLLVHCLFRQAVAASAFTRAPETPSGDLWSMSSPLPPDETFGGEERRFLLVNNSSAFRRIGELVRRIWEAAQPSRASVAPVADLPAQPSVAAPPDAAEPATAPAPEPVPEPEPPAPAGPPRFDARALWTPKRGNTEKQWEDAFDFVASAGVIAVADGAGAGIFSKLWANLLLESYIKGPVPLDDPAAVERWIGEQRAVWAKRVDYPNQRWSIQMRLDQTCGAATFLGLAIGDQPEGPEGAAPWRAAAVGDVCLFHVREGQLIDSFPVARSSDFGTTPPIFQSKPMQPMPAAIIRDGALLPGDLLLIATDALAQYLLSAVEAGNPPEWCRFWDLDQELWRQEIEALRDREAIVNDDCTLVVARLPGVAPAGLVPENEAEPATEAPPAAGVSNEAEAHAESQMETDLPKDPPVEGHTNIPEEGSHETAANP